MKKLTLWMMALAALQGTALQAQDITGNWQGTLQPGQQKVRLVFKIAMENDKLTATIHQSDNPRHKCQVSRKAERRRKLDRGDINTRHGAAPEPGARHCRDRLGDS